jgi:hypothetical protein
VVTRLSIALAVASLALLGCTRSRTQVLVEVHSDLLAPEQIDRIEISARSPENRVQSAFAVLGPGELPLPRVLTMDHTSGALGPYALTVRGEQNDTLVVAREASFTFQPGRTLVMRVDLVRACIGVTCAAGQTCAVGGCRSVEVAPGELSPWNGVPPPVDAAGVDACTTERCNGVDDDCDTRTDEGFDLDTDPRHCGACGMSCEQPNTTATCTAGECVVQRCQAPWADCDGNGRNGCETDTSSTPSHCGMCDFACTGPTRDCCDSVCGRC